MEKYVKTSAIFLFLCVFINLFFGLLFLTFYENCTRSETPLLSDVADIGLLLLFFSMLNFCVSGWFLFIKEELL